MQRSLGWMVALVLATTLVVAGRPANQATEPPPPLVVHNVYFSLNDPSMAAKEALLAACRKYLAPQPGITFFGCGTLADLAGPLNDRDYDVALHIAFQSKADLEKYDVSDAHKQFIEENKANWKKVRVFDSEVPSKAPAAP